jgi:hypothetical protein
LDKPLAVTNLEGKAMVNWTPSPSVGSRSSDLVESTLTAKLVNKEGTSIDEATLIIRTEDDLRAALIKLYKSTNGDNWTHNDNWCSEKDINEWYGVYKYKDKYYMFATFTQENGLRGTYSLCSDSLTGPFVPHSKGALTPSEWECLDGTLYIDDAGEPYLIFCHEHTQIVDGTICYAKLNESLDALDSDVVTMFNASSCDLVDPIAIGTDKHFVTDGPFMFRSKANELFMIWSSFIKGNYAELVVKFKDGKLGPHFEHMRPLLDNDGGHGMIFSDGKKIYFTYHTPNKSLLERPEFRVIDDNGDSICIKK